MKVVSLNGIDGFAYGLSQAGHHVQDVADEDIDLCDAVAASILVSRSSDAPHHQGVDPFGPVLDVVDEISAPWVLLESSTYVLQAGRGRTLGRALVALGERGYGWSYRVLDASGLGLPLRRKRWVLVGHLGDRTGPARVLLEPDHREDSADAGFLPFFDACEATEQPDALSEPADAAPAGADQPDLGSAEVGPVLYRKATQMMKPGGPVKWVRAALANPFTSFELSNTPYVHNLVVEGGVPRVLTPVECERLLGLPDDWSRYLLDGTERTNSQRWDLLGKTQPTVFGEWVGKRILKIEEQHE